jgi:hypothetical protein
LRNGCPARVQLTDQDNHPLWSPTMATSDPRTRHLRPLPDDAVAGGAVPSSTAQGRLTEALRDCADAYRADASVDLALVDVLVRMDQLEAAAQTLDEHRASLHAMAKDLQVVVADAAVEREAERVYDSCLRQVRSGAGQVGGLRRRLVALTGAAAVFVALLLPSSRVFPRTTLASIEDRVTHDEVAAARSRLDAARSTADALRADRQNLPVVAPAALRDPAVRKQVRAILSSSGKPVPADAGPVTVLAKVRAARDRMETHSQIDPADDGLVARVLPLHIKEPAPVVDPHTLVAPDVTDTDTDPDSPLAVTGDLPTATD